MHLDYAFLGPSIGPGMYCALLIANRHDRLSPLESCVRSGVLGSHSNQLGEVLPSAHPFHTFNAAARRR